MFRVKERLGLGLKNRFEKFAGFYQVQGKMLAKAASLSRSGARTLCSIVACIWGIKMSDDIPSSRSSPKAATTHKPLHV